MNTNDPAFARRVRLLMNLTFNWGSIAVRVSPSLVNQTIRELPRSCSLSNPVKYIRKKLLDEAAHYKYTREEQFREDYEVLAEEVQFLDFWEAVRDYIDT